MATSLFLFLICDNTHLDVKLESISKLTIIYLHNLLNIYRVFLPGLVGSTQSPGESLIMEEMNLNDYGVIEFGEDGKYLFHFIWKYYNFNFTKNIRYFMSYISFFLKDFSSYNAITIHTSKTKRLQPMNYLLNLMNLYRGFGAIQKNHLKTSGTM